MDGDRFVIQGDNNDWLDEDHPSAATRSSARCFLRIPQGGKALAALRSPGALGPGRRSRRSRSSAPRPPPAEPARRPRGRAAAPPRRPRAFSAPIRALARGRRRSVSGAVALVAAIGGGVLLALPSSQTESDHRAR